MMIQSSTKNFLVENSLQNPNNISPTMQKIASKINKTMVTKVEISDIGKKLHENTTRENNKDVYKRQRLIHYKMQISKLLFQAIAHLAKFRHLKIVFDPVLNGD